MDANTIIFLIALFGLTIVLWLWLPRVMMKRAASQIIRIFRAHHAFDITSAKTAQELGLGPRSLLRLSITRDWKPKALTLLLEAGVIQTTPDNKLYISESTLQNTIFSRTS